ncbi:flavin monoamine oxidase family protein [Wenyingzhuangia sp. IMCC45574]
MKLTTRDKTNNLCNRKQLSTTLRNMANNIIIIGAGLSGLHTAYQLQKKGFKVTVLEAKSKPGGRIYTKYNNNQAPIELGATWIHHNHTELLTLIKELNLEVFEQILGDRAIYHPMSTAPHQIVELPKNQEASYRVQGGTESIIKALVNQLDEQSLLLNQQINLIEKQEDMLIVHTQDQQFYADIVISTLPPNLFSQTIKTTPELPLKLKKIAEETHTWMGESIKIGFTFDEPFWRTNNLSGTLFSNIGVVSELYDHSNAEDNLYALKGFFNGAYYKHTKEERKQLVLEQLENYYGKEIHNYLTYEEYVWKKDEFVFSEYSDLVYPHQNNGHSVYQNSYLDNSLFLAGTETNADFSGYMEGAVRSANDIINKIAFEN